MDTTADRAVRNKTPRTGGRDCEIKSVSDLQAEAKSAADSGVARSSLRFESRMPKYSTRVIGGRSGGLGLAGARILLRQNDNEAAS